MPEVLSGFPTYPPSFERYLFIANGLDPLLLELSTTLYLLLLSNPRRLVQGSTPYKTFVRITSSFRDSVAMNNS